MAALTLDQLASGVRGQIACVALKGFDAEVHLQPLSMAQVAQLQKDLESLPEDDPEAYGKLSMAAMCKATLCDSEGKGLTQSQASRMIDNSSPQFMQALQEAITAHINPSVDDIRPNS